MKSCIFGSSTNPVYLKGYIFSSIIDGKVVDWSWKKHKTDTVFYIGDNIIGQLFKTGRSWSAVWHKPSYGPVHGFRTRMDASIYLEQLERKHRNKNNETVE